MVYIKTSPNSKEKFNNSGPKSGPQASKNIPARRENYSSGMTGGSANTWSNYNSLTAPTNIPGGGGVGGGSSSLLRNVLTILGLLILASCIYYIFYMQPK